jgi:serine/threonine protein kinase
MRVGEVLGRYSVTDVIGHGGMAVVYAGQDLALGHRVAIKVLHPDHVENPRMERRFVNEARALVAIRHPNIVELLDVGRTEEGDVYLVMELLEGESLATKLEQGPLTLAQALAFGRQLASALDAAHLQGIVHRDLKPANILLVPDPDDPGELRVKILDFGIAKQFIDGFTPAPITATGVIIGTPEYMSPEQCRGEELDGRSDIYCLGLLLYHMVAGRYPFEWGGETHEILARHLYGQSRPPSHLDPTVPAGLSRVIDRCMAKLPSGRYGRAGDVEQELLGMERLIFAHEDLAVDDHDRSTQLRVPLYRLTRETQIRRRTPFRWLREHGRDLSLAVAIGIGASGSSVLAEEMMSRRDQGQAEQAAEDPVDWGDAALEAPAKPVAFAGKPSRPNRPNRSNARTPEARTRLVADRESRQESKQEASRRAERPRNHPTPPPPPPRETRKAEPKRKAAPPPAAEPTPPPPAKSAPAEETYEKVETPVVY